MGKDKVNTQTTEQSASASNEIDRASQQYITNFLRPLGQTAANAIQNQSQPFFNAPTDQFLQGLGGMEGVMRSLQSGQFNQALQNQQYTPQGTGFTPGVIGDGGAMGIYQQAAAGGNPFNFNAGTFDPSRAQSFFSPFESQVVGSIQANADRQREQALNRAAQEATGAGAFGGSRSAMLQSQALRDANQDEAALVANLRNQGFQNAMGQALQAFGTEQATGLGAAQARASGALGMLGQGMQAAQLGQAGQIAQNEIGLRNAMANMQDRQFAGTHDLQRATSLQQGNLQGLAQTHQAAGGLMSGGETLRGIQNQMAGENLFRYQNAMELGQAGYGGPLGSSSQSSMSGFQEDRQKGDLLGDLMGAGMLAASFMGGGPLAAGAAQSFMGGQETARQAAPNLYSNAGLFDGLSFGLGGSAIQPSSLFGGGGYFNNSFGGF